MVEHFQDDGYSATSFKRPAFQQLLAYLKRHKKQIHYIFVTKWCRFSRDIENTILMNRELRELGTRVITLDDGEESDNPSNFLMSMLNMLLPDMDNRIRARNTKSGIRRALKEGYYPYGIPPKGYSKDHNSPKTPLLIPNEEASLVREAFEVFESGLFAIEDVRKAVWKNGLKLKRTQFGLMLRNPIYIGKILVPEGKDEDAHLVKGLHEAIVTEKTFWNVQKILDRRKESHSYLRTKEKLREELYLRGHLTCYQCGRNWTGSLSSGNGGKYPYYHCHRDCKVRANANEAHHRFSDYLKSFQPPSEIVNLYMAMMEAVFKANEGDRDKEISKIIFEIEQHQQNLLKFDQQRFISGELEFDSYKRLKSHTQEQIEKLKTKKHTLETSDTDFQKYCHYGMSLITHLDTYFQEAPIEVKRKMLGSIFIGKLTYEGGKYRTNGLNPALAIILQKSKGLQNEKTGNAFISENVSGNVPMTGLEPALYC